MKKKPIYDDYLEHIQRLALAGIAAADPYKLVQKHLGRDGQVISLPDCRHSLDDGRLWLVAVGKAAIPMSQAALEILGADIAGGIVVSKTMPPQMPASISAFQAGHPIPNERSVHAGKALKALLANARPGDLVLTLLSGGASALLSLPQLPLLHFQALNQALLRAGCPIEAVNRVRQWFDEIKGGGLSRLAAPARCAALILSDVIGNDLRFIGSGLTVAVEQNAQEVKGVLDKWEVWREMPAQTRQLVIAGLQRSPPPRPPDAGNAIIGDVRLAAQAVKREAEALGFRAIIVDTTVTGEAKRVGADIAGNIANHPQTPPFCVIFGGETTVRVSGEGMGGRNQEAALGAAFALAGKTGLVFASFATDGDDGLKPTQMPAVAGAVVSDETIKMAAYMGLDAERFLRDNDSYAFFRRLGSGHIIAPQGTNVNDVMVGLAYEDQKNG